MNILEHIKSFMRVDFADDDQMISSLITVASQYITNATGHIIDTTVDYDLLVLSLTVKHFYDNRSGFSEVQLQEVPMSLRSLYLQLQSQVIL